MHNENVYSVLPHSCGHCTNEARRRVTLLIDCPPYDTFCHLLGDTAQSQHVNSFNEIFRPNINKIFISLNVTNTHVQMVVQENNDNSIGQNGHAHKVRAVRLIELNKKAQLSLTNPRDACEKFARFT